MSTSFRQSSKGIDRPAFSAAKTKKGPEYAGAFLLQSGNTTRYKPPRELRTYEFARCGIEPSLDFQGVSYKACLVADANLDQNPASKNEFCEFRQKFSDMLHMSNRGLLSCDSIFSAAGRAG
jgi:hypothetical protein